jgi:hypothetical protein
LRSAKNKTGILKAKKRGEFILEKASDEVDFSLNAKVAANK